MSTKPYRASWLVFLLDNWHKILLLLLAYFFLIRPNLPGEWSLHTFFKSKDSQAGGLWVYQKEASQIQELDMGLLPVFSSDKPYPLQLTHALQSVPEDVVYAFVNRFGHVAQNEQEKYGIPASITLAVGILCSTSGTGEATVQYNNYFLVPCTPDWSGNRAGFHGKCIRKYETAWLSFRDHSRYLAGSSQLMSMRGDLDYRHWAKGLQKQRLYPVKNAARTLVNIIEKYQLADYDSL